MSERERERQLRDYRGCAELINSPIPSQEAQSTNETMSNSYGVFEFAQNGGRETIAGKLRWPHQ